MQGRTVPDLRALFSFICMWPHQVFGNTKRKNKELSEDCLYLLLLFAHPSLRFKDRVRIAGPRENKSCKLYMESVTTTSGVPWILGGGHFNNRKKHPQIWKSDPKTPEDQGEELAHSLCPSLSRRGNRDISWPESTLNCVL